MKAWTIAWKDTLIRFRDRNGLLSMLAAPLIMAAIVGAALGNFSSTGSSPIRDIPIIIVNDDQGELGQNVVDALISDDLADLLEPTLMDDLAAARQIIETGGTRAVIYIQSDFSDRLHEANGAEAQTTAIQLYTDPAANVSPLIMRSIVDQIAGGFSEAAISARVSHGQILAHAETLGPALANFDGILEEELGPSFAQGAIDRIELNSITVGDKEDAEFSIYAFIAPSMAIFFLMFAAFTGTRSILTEKTQGTFSRLLSTPTSLNQILVGKIGGTFLTGMLQFIVLVVASRLIFGLNWGSSLPGLILMMFAVVAAATSLGALVAALAKDANQANVIGGAIALIFAALGGTFGGTENFPDWLHPFSRMTITRWGLDGFTDLTISGLGLSDILLEAGVLLGIALLLFVLAVQSFRRQIK